MSYKAICWCGGWGGLGGGCWCCWHSGGWQVRVCLQGIPLANTTLTSTNFVLKELSWFWRIRSADWANGFLPLFFYWRSLGLLTVQLRCLWFLVLNFCSIRPRLAEGVSFSFLFFKVGLITFRVCFQSFLRAGLDMLDPGLSRAHYLHWILKLLSYNHKL